MKKNKTSKKYWYFYWTQFCPVCGHEESGKERRYTKKPERWTQRHVFDEVYDWCDVL